ncbi:MAG: hypothetical protein JW809_08690 [Pirellulales bacterium]|nr:hypothetical protein [Pirellulales bacterium]
MKDLNLARRRLGDQWQDDKFREFQETFLDPLEPKIRTLLTSLAELDEVLAKAERACGEN